MNSCLQAVRMRRQTVAFIGPAFHQKTESSGFFISFLQAAARVEVLWDHSWEGIIDQWVSTFRPKEYDCIIIWQWSSLLLSHREELASHRNVVLVPMVDQVIKDKSRFWPILYSVFKILCFSPALHRVVMQYTDKVLACQYYVDPDLYKPRDDMSGLRAFFWRRIPLLDEALIARLCGEVMLDQFTLHWCPDPSAGEEVALDPCPVSALRHNSSTWFATRKDYLSTLRQHNMFFAPRWYEGIGMAFLEAMAMGLCVIAPNTPTHSDVITSGRSGLLYGPTFSVELHCCEVDRMGREAREASYAGHLAWKQSARQIRDFLDS